MSARELITKHLDLWTGAVTHKSTAGRGRNGKIELTGIKKLRELILELAVRGKLVEQDPSDEPTSVLLERIAEEKARLVKEGKIKKPKKLPEITEEEVTAKLPTAWTWTRLGEITNYGVTDKAEPDEVEDTTWVLELEDIEKESSRLIQRVTYKDRQFKSSKNRFLAEDVLYGKLRPYLDKVLVADIQGVCTTEIIPIRGFGGVIPSYLRLALKSPTFKQYANNSTHGMNLPRLGTDKARLALISLPPTDEQCRIVEKADELMALCDRLEQQVGNQLEAHEVLVDTLLEALTRSADATEVAENWARIAQHFDTLFTTEASIDKLKKTILQLAVMGLLVPQDPTEKHVSSLIERIKEEKSSLSAEGNLKKIKNLPPVSASEKPYQIPSHWEWVRLGTIAEAHTGNAFKSQEYTSEGVFVLRVTNINQDGTIDAADAKYIPQKMANSEYRRFQLSKGDILLVMVGGSLGKIGIVGPNVLPAVLNQNMWKLQRFGGIPIDYFVYGLKQINANQIAITSSTHGHLAQGAYMSKLFPLPPIDEQHRIVEKVDELMALCDRLKARLGEVGETRTQLAEAVVEQAVQ